MRAAFHHLTMDLDSWNVSLYPDDLTRFWNPLLSLQLSCYAPDKKHKDAPLFKNWVFVARCGGHIRIDPEFKEPLFEAIKAQGKVILPNAHPTAFIKGSHTITAGSLIRALNDIECASVRVSSYGMKEPIVLPVDLGNPEHPMAIHNSFDLGFKHKTDSIVLVAPKLKTRGISRYPILNPINKDHGTISCNVTMGGHKYKVKVYSPLIHCIKAMAPPATLTTANKIGTCIRRLEAAKKYAAKLRTMDWSSFTGLRMEATVVAPTLAQAIAQVKGSWTRPCPFSK